ncbi:zinc-binding alcohol dehydrogenase family protein [Paenibacillus koleovorans]|uniref:zinc-binding alcohol dehydrogenase family protein n=1 Tax=Paenibacillus koleovorans TaxID=121608 RepID=UPI000FD9949C|nr:zinc-binding alcohol dehydrogenase family protein [Paenibacillus koleovorans]
MKGIVCEQPGQFRLVEMEEPAFVPGEAIIRIKRIGICGTDLHAYRGNQPFFQYPRVLGHELAGVIEEVGENTAGFRKGDQVSVIPYLHCGACIACRNGKTNCCTAMRVLGVHKDGGMRELISVPVSLLIKTEGLTLDQAAILEPLSIGAHAVRRAAVRSGETVLVIGAGPIGLGVMAFAKHCGATVIAMDINQERLDYCVRWANVDQTIHALDQPVEQLTAITDGHFPTAVFDATGNARSMTESFRYVAHGGTLVFVGLVKSDITFNDPEFHKREMTLMGSRNATKSDFEHVLEVVRTGRIDADRYVTHRAPFTAMIGQFDNWLKPESQVIKAMVEL